MTPEQRNTLHDKILLTPIKSVFAYVDSLLAAERAAVVVECEQLCVAAAEMARARMDNAAAYNRHDPAYYASHQEACLKAHNEDAAAIRKLGEKRGPD